MVSDTETIPGTKENARVLPGIVVCVEPSDRRVERWTLLGYNSVLPAGTTSTC